MSHCIFQKRKKSLQILHILNREIYNIRRNPLYSKKISLLRTVCLKNFLNQHTGQLVWLGKILQQVQCKERIKFVQTFYNCMIEKHAYDPNSVFVVH